MTGPEQHDGNRDREERAELAAKLLHPGPALLVIHAAHPGTPCGPDTCGWRRHAKRAAS